MTGRRVEVGEGFVELVDIMPREALGGAAADRGGVAAVHADPVTAAVVGAARVSYGGGTRRVSSDRGLLRFLLRHRHTTPFEQVTMTWRVRAPLFVARQWMRHRTGSFNEESARYSVVEDRVYAPPAEAIRCQSTTNRQGSGGALADPSAARDAAAIIARANAAARRAYDALLEAGVAREQARAVLPVGMYTTFVWTVSLWNLFHFLKLRMDAHAQQEIREFAQAIYEILGPVAPVAREAFADYILDAVTLTGPEVRAIRAALDTNTLAALELDGATGRERGEWREKRARLFGNFPGEV